MATHKEIAEAFNAAKDITALNGAGCSSGEWQGLGASGRHEFICHALDKVGTPGAKEAQGIIRDRFGLGTIYGWLRNYGISTSLLTDDNVQAYKHRWLDSVIKEFSK